MNVEQPPCASVDQTPDWDRIDWSQCEREIRRLQARIVKATQERRWGRMKSLQWLLTHSFSGKALAVNRVTENKGKNTPGVDGAIWSTPKAKMKGLGSLQRRGYKPMPLRRVYIPKSNGKLRPLSIPCMIDRAQQALHLLALEPVAETMGDPNSYGFRKGRSTADAIEQAWKTLNKRVSPQWVLEADIKSCFDKISFEWMLENIPTDTQVLSKWLRCGFMERGTWLPTTEGTPQGAIISPTAANVVLDGLEKLLEKRFPRTWRHGIRRSPMVNFIRYADDFIVTGSSKELLENEVIPVIESFLKERGLELSREKTKITHISVGFDFLGQHLRKYGDTLLVTPSKKNVLAFYQKVREILFKSGNLTQAELIMLLNPVLRGWANYHRHISASRVFGSMDRIIWYALVRWARRRHPEASAGWIASKYWHYIDGRSVFAAVSRTRDGTSITYGLISLAQTRIRRHIKIRGNANPFDPDWSRYFEERAVLKCRPALPQEIHNSVVNTGTAYRRTSYWLEPDAGKPARPVPRGGDR